MEHCVNIRHINSSIFSPSLSLALSLSVVDGGDVKVDRWGWQPDNRLLSSASVTGLFFLAPMYPMCPLSSTSSYGPVLSSLAFTPFSHQHCSPYLPSFTLTLSTQFPIFLPFPPFLSPIPPVHSFTQCHYGPTLTEAFIKCQLYTRDHTVEGQDTMISDPQRSTCLWAFSSCWRTVCQL